MALTNRERAEHWVADRSAKGFYSPTTTDSLTLMLNEVERDAFDATACDLVRFLAAYESMRRRFGDEYEGRFAECDELPAEQVRGRRLNARL